MDDADGMPWNELLALQRRRRRWSRGRSVGRRTRCDLLHPDLQPDRAFFSPEIDAAVDVSPERSADVDLNRQVNVSDLLLVISTWNLEDAGREDIDRNGVVDVSDLLLVISQWGETP